MKLVYAVSQQTRSKRPAARHLDNGDGKPLCGGNGREPFLWAPEAGEPTCKICQDIALIHEDVSQGVGDREHGLQPKSGN